MTFIRRTYEPLKFLGRLFWVPLTVTPNVPLLSFTHTWEANGDFWGPTAVARVPLTRFAIGLGVWLNPPDIPEIRDEDAEYATYVAVNGRVPREQWQAARREIAARGLDPDEEMELMQTMGVFE